MRLRRFARGLAWATAVADLACLSTLGAFFVANSVRVSLSYHPENRPHFQDWIAAERVTSLLFGAAAAGLIPLLVLQGAVWVSQAFSSHPEPLYARRFDLWLSVAGATVGLLFVALCWLATGLAGGGMIG